MRTDRRLIPSLLLLGAAFAPLAAVESLTVDFSAHADPPLVKKLSLMNSGLVSRPQYERDIASFGLVRPEAFRIDLSIGKDDCPMWADLVGGTASALTYDWTNADWLKARYDEQDILPYWCVSYIPHPLQLTGQSGRNQADGVPWAYVDDENGAFDWAAWRRVGKDFTSHFRAGGRTGYYEVYNEGDLQLEATDDPATSHGGTPLRLPVQFVNGQNTDAVHRKAVMTKLHAQMALGMRDGDPDAVIGGPAYSGFSLNATSGFPQAFLDGVQAAGAPLDFFSYHAVGIDTPRASADERTALVGGLLDARPRFRTTEMHLNEYFPYAPLNQPGFVAFTPANPYAVRQPGVLNGATPQVANPYSCDLAVHLLDDLQHFVGQTELTQVAWAFAFDPLFDDFPVNSFGGLIASQDTAKTIAERRRKVFSAFAFYGDLPLQRVALDSAGQIRGLAGVGADKAGVVLWNLGQSADTVHLAIAGLPFADATFSTYAIDGDAETNGHNPHGFEASTAQDLATGGALAWDGAIPARGVVYLRWNAAAQPVAAPAAQLVRVHHDYDARGSTCFGEFDRRGWTAYVGTGANPGAADRLVEVGAAVRGLDAGLRVDVAGEGPLPGAAGAYGLRIDYHVGGAYATSVLFHAGAKSQWSIPWGTARDFDREVQVASLAHFDVDVGAFAPAGWDGQALLTAVLWKAGANARAAFTFRPGAGSAGGLAGEPAGATVTATAGTGRGLSGAYYAGQDFAPPLLLARLDPVIDFDWNLASPDQALPHTAYCARWTGFIEAPADGDFTLIARTDDGVRLSFAGTRVIDQWVGHPPADAAFVARGLHAGQRYPVQMDYFQGTGGAEAHLLWSGPGTPRQVIPRSRLYPAAPATTAPAATAGGDLVAWYRFTEDGAPGRDASGHGNDALTVSGVAGAADSAHPRAVRVDAGSVFTIPVAARDAFTLSLWLKTAASGGGDGQWYAGLGLLDADLPGSDSDFGLSMLTGKAGFGAGAADTTVKGTTAIDDGQWHLVTATRSADGQLQVLVDGVSQGQSAGPSGARSAPLAIRVGALSSGANPLVGAVDDIRIYRRVLTASEVLAIKAEAPAGTGTGGGGGTGTGGGGTTTTATGSSGSGCGSGSAIALIGLLGFAFLAGGRRR